VVSDGGNYDGCTLADFGLPQLTTLVQNIAQSGRDVLSSAMVPTSVPGIYRLGGGMISMRISTGLADWHTAVCLLDPSGNNNYAAGVTQVLDFLEASIDMIAAQNLRGAAFEMARQVANQDETWAVIITLMINVVRRPR
jgi:hypothetical protein